MISQFKDMTMFHKLTFERMRKFGKSNSRLSKLICFGINSLFYALKLLAITKQKSNKIFCTVHPSSDQPGIDSFFENRTNLRWSLGLETETSWQTFLRQPLQMDILIIGTPFLRQCYEYRIRNKIQQLQKLGAKVTFVPYKDRKSACRERVLMPV